MAVRVLRWSEANTSMEAAFRVLTPRSRGAIAVVRVWGTGALVVVDTVFRPNRGRSLSETEYGRLRLGRAGKGVGDEVVAIRLDGMLPTVEIHCHGGTAAVASVVQSLIDAGAVSSDDDPVARRLSADRIRAQAIEDLAVAPTLKAAEILLDQSHGALDRSLEHLSKQVVLAGDLGVASPLLAELDDLIRLAAVGIRLLCGWRVVIAGRPNVGKSRLFNALAGFERSIVNPQAGVTRDVVAVRTAFGGWPVELSDTAGDRESSDAVERLGIGRARRKRHDADLVLLVLDGSEPLQDVDVALLETTPNALVVANKNDLPIAWDAGRIDRTVSNVHSVSAETGAGLGDLMRAVGCRLVPEPPVAGVGVPFRAEHQRNLEQARVCLVSGDREGLVHRLGEIGKLTSSL
jgi:tRNA modification GTPase